MAQVTDKEDFTYASLVNRWRRERATTTLSKMDEDFYGEFDRYLRTLREEYQAEQKKNAASPKVLILLDELTNLQRVREDLYDLRERKVVTAAIIAARDGRPDHAHMTRGEKVLFDALLLALRQSRQALISAPPPEPHKATGGPPLAPEPGPAVAAAQPAAPLAERARVAEASPESPLPGAPLPPPARASPAAEEVAPQGERRVGPTRMLVRVKGDVEPFVAPDLRHYRLQAEDVAALPREVAHLLIQRGLATAMGG